jgi:RNA polymerase sigma factor FliA
MGAVEIDKLWEEFLASRAVATREQLILYYAPLVKRIASRMGVIESPTMDYQDLISHGVAGLIEAVDRFDMSRGIAFEAFATQRIRGSMLDALRSLDFVSRSARRRAAEIEEAIAELRNRHGRTPVDEEIASHLGIEMAEYYQALSQANTAFLSLESPFADADGGGETILLGEALEDRSMRDVSGEVIDRDMRNELADAIRELPQREQLVLSLYYYEELTVREVGAVLDLSASRVSQVLAKAIMLLRAKMLYDVAPKASRVTARPQAVYARATS